MNSNLSMNRESPFQPGKPVSPEHFIGRLANIEKIARYSNNAIHSDAQHFFLTGKSCIGKTSLVKFVANILKSLPKNMIF